MPDEPFCCGAIVLAGGASSRLGQPKQLVTVDGESLLRRTVRLALESDCSPVVAVLGFRSAEMERELAGLAALITIHEHWAEGMGTSLSHGMKSLLSEQPAPGHVLVLVCDQPLLDRSHLLSLLEKQRSGSPATASFYNGSPGVPAVFAARYFPELLRLGGDQGARRFLRDIGKEVTLVDFPGGAFDVDFPEDLYQLK